MLLKLSIDFELNFYQDFLVESTKGSIQIHSLK